MDFKISTHAPRTGSDFGGCPPCPIAVACDFNPRSPHGERLRRLSALPYRSGLRFQPTLPARGATARNLRASPGPGISTHAPRMGSDRPLVDGGRGILISTHAPRTGSDTGARIRPRFSATFQPTLPARGATSKPPKTSGGFEISTHAPRTGSDGGVPERHRAPLNFNPRSPHGERRAPATSGRPREPFQPTLPARGATRST